MIGIGTSGYQYDALDGVFYPAGLAPTERLAYYAGEFLTVELTGTAAAWPQATEMARLAAQAPARFLFSVMAYSGLLEDGRPERWEEFGRAVAPLESAGMLAAILVSCPLSFERSAENQEKLLAARAGLGSVPVAVEFRHKSWVVEGMEGWLHSQRLNYCCVDLPRVEDLAQPVAWVTGELAYVRFHGRNYTAWQGGGDGGQHDYEYDVLELAEWLPKLDDLARAAERLLIYVNTAPGGQSVATARMLKRLLDMS